jgi:hypothetical protein
MQPFGYANHTRVVILIPNDREVMDPAFVQRVAANISPLHRAEHRMMRTAPEAANWCGLVV